MRFSALKSFVLSCHLSKSQPFLLLPDDVSVNNLNNVPFGRRNSEWWDTDRLKNRRSLQAGRVLE